MGTKIYHRVNHVIYLYFVRGLYLLYCLHVFINNTCLRYLCLPSWMCLSEHSSGTISVHGECHRSRPGHWRQCSLLLPANISILCYRWGPRHCHHHQTFGLWDNLSLPANRQCHSQYMHKRNILSCHKHNFPVTLMHMETLYFYLCFYQDQDKVRPLSRLANLAITITDVQDMDPIFTNLPYSTNIEEDIPLVSNTTLPHITLYYLHAALMWNSVICNPFLSLPSFSVANMSHLSFTLSLTQLPLSHVHTPFWLFRRC